MRIDTTPRPDVRDMAIGSRECRVMKLEVMVSEKPEHGPNPVN